MTARTSLLVVSATLGGGGAERVTSTLLTYLDRARFRPHLCVLRGPFTYVLPRDVPVAVLGKTRPYHIPGAVWKLRRLIRQLQPDVVMGNMLYTNWLIGAAMVGLRPRPRWIARHAAPPTIFETRKERAVAPLVHRLLTGASLHVANSKALAVAVRTWLPGAADRVTTIYNPVDLAYIERQAQVAVDDVLEVGAPVLLWAGRLEWQKRPDVLLRAFAMVRAAESVQLLILGEGSLRPHMERLARDLGIAGDVHFLGFDTNPYRWMRRATVFVLTSDFEGLPNALLEAQALGVPAVSTRCPTGPDEIIADGVTGLLAPVGDADAIGSRIVELLGSTERRRAMGAAARERLSGSWALTTVMRQWERTLLAPALDETEAQPGTPT